MNTPPAETSLDPIEPEPKWIAVARLMRPQGRRGELLAEPLSDLAEIFQVGRQYRLTHRESGTKEVTLESSWQPQGRKAGLLVLKFAGCDTISAAELLEGSQLEIPESELPALAEDTFLVRDLLGCTLWDGDQVLGTVVDLQFPIAADGRTRLADAPDLLVIEPSALPTSGHDLTEAEVSEAAALSAAESQEAVHSDKEDDDLVLVPFVKAWLDEVDLPGKRLRMHLPPGLAR